MQSSIYFLGENPEIMVKVEVIDDIKEVDYLWIYIQGLKQWTGLEVIPVKPQIKELGELVMQVIRNICHW